MRPWTTAMQAVEGEARARVKHFEHGAFPRASEILKLLATGPLSEWIRNLPAEEEREQYDTADEPGVDASQSQAGVNELPANGAASLLGHAKAAAMMQRGMAGGSRQQSAQQC